MIAIEERRQLLTLGFAVVVFIMTLVALQLRNQVCVAKRPAAATVARFGDQNPVRINRSADLELKLAVSSVESR